MATTDAVVRNNSEGSLEIIEEPFKTEDVDLKVQLLRLREKHADGILLSTQSEVAFVRALKQMRELQWRVPVYGSMIPGSKTFLNLAGSHAEIHETLSIPSRLRGYLESINSTRMGILMVSNIY